MAYQGRQTGETGVTLGEAMLMLQRSVGLASRIALGDGLDAYSIAQVLLDEANAIQDPSSVAEDMSPIQFHME